MANTTLIRSSKRQSFTTDEKQRMVEEFLASGEGLNAFSKKMGINPGSLHQWREKFATKCTEKNLPAIVSQETCSIPQDQNQLEALHQLNRDLKTENDTLKKDIFKIQSFLGRKIFELELRNA